MRPVSQQRRPKHAKNKGNAACRHARRRRRLPDRRHPHRGKLFGLRTRAACSPPPERTLTQTGLARARPRAPPCRSALGTAGHQALLPPSQDRSPTRPLSQPAERTTSRPMAAGRPTATQVTVTVQAAATACLPSPRTAPCSRLARALRRSWAGLSPRRLTPPPRPRRAPRPPVGRTRQRAPRHQPAGLPPSRST